MNLTPAKTYNGILPIDKPAGITSARAVSMVKRLLPRGTKIGHAGTLDPFATGLLLLLVGKATKKCEEVMDQPKCYEATVKLGMTTPTDDPESPEQPFGDSASPQAIEVGSIDRALKEFTGAIVQVPPVFSAIKLGGKRACDRVRAGETVELRPRTVRIYAIEMLDYEWPLLRLRIDCGRGTYIRALARDLGARLGVGGYLTQLRRTRIGAYNVKDAVSLDTASMDLLTALLHVVAPPLQNPAELPPPAQHSHEGERQRDH